MILIGTNDLDRHLVVPAINITAAPSHVETDVYLISGVNPKDRRDHIIYQEIDGSFRSADR